MKIEDVPELNEYEALKLGLADQCVDLGLNRNFAEKAVTTAEEICERFTKALAADEMPQFNPKERCFIRGLAFRMMSNFLDRKYLMVEIGYNMSIAHFAGERNNG